jgi:hypothetical protein
MISINKTGSQDEKHCKHTCQILASEDLIQIHTKATTCLTVNLIQTNTYVLSINTN